MAPTRLITLARTPALLVWGLALAFVLALASCRGRSTSDRPDDAPPEDARALPAFDPSAFGLGPPPSTGPRPPLDVIGYGPVGTGDGTIHVRFNQPVVPLGEDAPAPALRVEPPLKGATRWQTPSMLVFQPDQTLPRAQRYTVTLEGPVLGAGGLRHDAPLSWTFSTAPPTITNADPAGLERDVPRVRPLLVVVDQPISLKAVTERARARARPIDTEAWQPVELTVRVARQAELMDRYLYVDEDSERGFAIEPRHAWPAGSEIEVTIPADLTGELGPVASATDWSTRFYSAPKLQVESRGCDAEPCGLEPITITLSTPITSKQLRKITLSPRPKEFARELVDEWDEGDGGREVQLLGRYLPGETYRVTIPATLRDVHGQRLGETVRYTARFGHVPTLGLSPHGGALKASGKQWIGITTRHLADVEVRAAVVGDDELARVVRPTSGDAKIPWPNKPVREFKRRYSLTPGGPTEWATVTLDLADITGGERRPLVVEVRPRATTAAADAAPLPEPVRALFSVTSLAAVGVHSDPQSAIEVRSLVDGSPRAGVSVIRVPTGAPAEKVAVTDDRGIAIVRNDASKKGKKRSAADRAQHEVFVLLDAANNDRTYLDRARDFTKSQADDLRPGERILGELVTERDAYRPGETVRVVGWTAVESPYVRSGLRRLPAGRTVSVEVRDRDDGVVARVETRTTKEGKLWAELPLTGARLGRHTVRASGDGLDLATQVKVEDYRTPEFEVTATTPTPDVLADAPVEVQARARYYFGGPVHIAALHQSVSCHPTSYRPPGLDPVWVVNPHVDHTSYYHRYHIATSSREDVRIDEAARARGDARFTSRRPTDDEQEEEYPERCTVSVAVRDDSFQEVGAELTLMRHPARLYLALETPEEMLEEGERPVVRVRAVDWEGARAALDGVRVAIEREWEEREYKTVKGERVFAGMTTKTAAFASCELTLTAAGADAGCKLPALKRGRYHVRASAKVDGHEVASHDTLSAWPKVYDWFPEHAPKRLELSTRATVVRPDEDLDVAIAGPFADASGLLYSARRGLRDVHPFALRDEKATITLRTDDTWTPAVTLGAVVVTPPKTSRGFPRVHKSQTVTLSQGAAHRRLAVEVTTPRTAGPGDQAPIAVSVRDQAGAPVAARVALWAVDEAVLSLTNYEIPDLLASFLPYRQPEVDVIDSYGRLRHPFAPYDDPWLATGESLGVGGLGLIGRGAGGGSGSGYGSAGIPPARSRFETTPLFLADIATGKDGNARATVRLPDNLTTFRVTAIASARLVDGESPGRFGVSDARVRVTKPLIVRPHLPRGLRPNDEVELAASVRNDSSLSGAVEVTVKVTGDDAAALTLTGAKRRRITLQAGEEQRLSFPAKAVATGSPKLELRATLTAGNEVLGDAAELPVPIAAERTLTERAATYGSLDSDEPVVIPIRLPSAVLPDHGGVTISTSSSLLGGLQDAAAALIDYPYGCVEQTSSKLLPLVALGELARAYPLGVDDPAEFVQAGVARLLSMQTDSGGFSYWPGGRVPHAYASAYATWILYMTKESGYSVPEAALERALDYLARELAPADAGAIAASGDYLRRVRQAIAAYTLARAGRATAAARVVDALYERRGDLPRFARGFLTLAVHSLRADDPRLSGLVEDLLAALAETPGTARVVERVPYSLDAFFHSDARSDAIVLLALVTVRPDEPRVEKLARGLGARRVGGRWRNTQENAYAVLALAAFARVYEREEPSFSARAWVAGKPVLSDSFQGREFTTHEAAVPMIDLIAGASAKEAKPAEIKVHLAREGAGRMYYRLGAAWAPAEQASLPTIARGLELRRSLRTAAGPLPPGASVAAGELVALDVEITSQAPVPYVVIDVPLPAGLEVVHRDLGRGHAASLLGGGRGWWVSHEELHHDRALIFVDDLSQGTFKTTVDLRAITPGRYAFPPARAEAMYMPEVYGRSDGGRLTVQ